MTTRQATYDQQGETLPSDDKKLWWIARDLSLKCRQAIIFEAERANVPTIKYKYQYLLETVIKDMESFV